MTQSVPVELFGYPTSPYVQKMKLVLDYKQIDYRFIGVTPAKKKELAFTGNIREATVPVVRVGEEWRMDSTPIARWLEDYFPEKPLFGKSEQDQSLINELDHWVSQSLIAGVFRNALTWHRPLGKLRDGWRLARIVNASTPIPLAWRLFWPLALTRVDFIKRIVSDSDLDIDESIPAMRQRLADEFVQKLQSGPYLGGLPQPSIADLAAFSTFWFGYSIGATGPFPQAKNGAIIDWSNRIASQLPDHCFPFDRRFVKRPIPQG